MPHTKSKGSYSTKRFQTGFDFTSFSQRFFEKVILSQTISFIETNIYNDTQSGFRKGHSTSTLLLKLRNDIKNAMDRNEITLNVMIDYSKAFDTIDHTILIQKLESFNFGKAFMKVIISYLSNRKTVRTDRRTPVKQRKYLLWGPHRAASLVLSCFNMYVAELPDRIKSPSIQYARRYDNISIMP